MLGPKNYKIDLHKTCAIVLTSLSNIFIDAVHMKIVVVQDAACEHSLFNDYGIFGKFSM